jgi:sulfoxide reductase heme-binding subunit YedZ
MTRPSTRSGPPLERHAAAAGLLAALALLFWWLQQPLYDEVPEHFWNRVFADTSMVLLCLVLVIGPLARYVPAMRKVVPWRRELGVAMFIAAGLHVAIALGGFYDWDPLGFFTTEDRGTGQRERGRDAGAAANWVGLVALTCASVLAVTSNDVVQARLGRGWKFVQRQSYTLFVLTALHVAGFIYLAPFTPTGAFNRWFWALTAIVVATQFAGFVRTVRGSTGPRDESRAPRAKTAEPPSVRTVLAKRAAVPALWSSLIVVSLVLALG